MEKALKQIYPSFEDLAIIKELLPKKDKDGTSADKVAFSAKCSKSNVYNVLKNRYKNIGVINACLYLIIETARKKEAIALSLLQDFNQPERV
jgi:DNA invertase Pin-like site-specific DNA recombinase